MYKKETVFVLAFRQRTDEKPSAKTTNNQKDEKKGTGVREPLNRIEQICRTHGGPVASFFGLDQTGRLGMSSHSMESYKCAEAWVPERLLVCESCSCTYKMIGSGKTFRLCRAT